MNHMYYELAQQRAAEMRRAAREAGQARAAASERRRRGKAARSQEIAVPVIPDYAHEMFHTEGKAVPTPRQAADGRRAGSVR